jgi:hypothetical protein
MPCLLGEAYAPAWVNTRSSYLESRDPWHFLSPIDFVFSSCRIKRGLPASLACTEGNFPSSSIDQPSNLGTLPQSIYWISSTARHLATTQACDFLTLHLERGAISHLQGYILEWSTCVRDSVPAQTGYLFSPHSPPDTCLDTCNSPTLTSKSMLS